VDNLMQFYDPKGPNAPRTADHLIAQESEKLEKRQVGGCSANTLLFGRGTTEVGVMGSTVGPALQRGLTGAGWKVQGIQYSADLGGIYCLGMTGGLKCRDQVNALGKRCPNTKIVLSGYSQGAMVARICAAWADPSVKKQIKVRILTFRLYCMADGGIRELTRFRDLRSSETHLTAPM
jgi:cutinase